MFNNAFVWLFKMYYLSHFAWYFAHCYYLEYKERYIGIESKKKKYDR